MRKQIIVIIRNWANIWLIKHQKMVKNIRHNVWSTIKNPKDLNIREDKEN